MTQTPWIFHNGEHKSRATFQSGVGGYDLAIQARPEYCDRGDWTLFAEPWGSPPGTMDVCDQMPRFFYGSLDEAKEQLGRFLSKRKDHAE